MKRNTGIVVDRSLTSISQNERIRFVVLHYTVLGNDASINTLSRGQVSSHYLLLNPPPTKRGKPVVLGLVADDKRAWHAGLSRWHGRVNLNDTSIGIEIVNPGYVDLANGGRQWFPFGERQISALTILLKDITTRYGIAPEDIVGHADIAPLRKQDPGPLFPWAALAKRGIGAWPEPQRVARELAGQSPAAPVPVALLQQEIKRYGYDDMPSTGAMDESTQKIIAAFQMHFRPRDYSGCADAETLAIARVLNDQYRR